MTWHAPRHVQRAQERCAVAVGANVLKTYFWVEPISKNKQNFGLTKEGLFVFIGGRRGSIREVSIKKYIYKSLIAAAFVPSKSVTYHICEKASQISS